MGVLVGELGALYEAALRGVPASQAGLPELPVQYGDFSVWQREWVRANGFRHSLPTGVSASGTAGPTAGARVPTDHSRPPLQRYEGARVSRRVPRAVVEDL